MSSVHHSDPRGFTYIQKKLVKCKIIPSVTCLVIPCLTPPDIVSEMSHDTLGSHILLRTL